MAGIALLFITLWQTLPKWLPRVITPWLPAGSQLVLQGPLRWQHGALHIDAISFSAQACVIASVSGVSLSYQRSAWRLNSEQANLDTGCFSKLPTERGKTPFALDRLQNQLPPFDLTIGHFSVTPWPLYAGKMRVVSSDAGQRLQYWGQNLSAEAKLNTHQQLTLTRLSITPPNSGAPIKLTGETTIPLDLAHLPTQGMLQGEVETAYLENPLSLDFHWQHRRGVLILKEKGKDQPLATLPWEVAPQQIRIDKGEWHWPYGAQPLSGGLSLALHDWDEGFGESQLSARLNVITAGNNGKGNAVLTLGPGTVSLINSELISAYRPG